MAIAEAEAGDKTGFHCTYVITLNVTYGVAAPPRRAGAAVHALPAGVRISFFFAFARSFWFFLFVVVCIIDHFQAAEHLKSDLASNLPFVPILISGGIGAYVPSIAAIL